MANVRTEQAGQQQMHGIWFTEVTIQNRQCMKQSHDCIYMSYVCEKPEGNALNKFSPEADLYHCF